MKTLFYLYELDTWKGYKSSVPYVDAMPAYDYIEMHMERLQWLLASGSRIASDKYALEHDTCPMGAYNKIVKDRNDAIDFWSEKLKEF